MANDWNVVGVEPAAPAPSDPWAVVGEAPASQSQPSAISPDLASMLRSGVQQMETHQAPGPIPAPQQPSFASRAWEIANHPLASGEQMLPGLGLIESGAEAASRYLAAHGHPTAAKAFSSYAGAEHGVGDAAAGMTSPIGLGLAATGLSEESVAGKMLLKLGVDPAIVSRAVPMAQRLMSLGFSEQNFAGAYRDVPQFRQAVHNGDYETASRLAVGMLTQTALGALSAFHGVAPHPSVASETTESKPVTVTPAQADAIQQLDATHVAHPETGEWRATGITSPEMLAEQAGLLHKGELTAGSGVHQFEHPAYPGLTMALNEGDLSTPEALLERMNQKIADFRQSPSDLVKSIIARGDAKLAEGANAQPGKMTLYRVHNEGDEAARPTGRAVLTNSLEQAASWLGHAGDRISTFHVSPEDVTEAQGAGPTPGGAKWFAVNRELQPTETRTGVPGEQPDSGLPLDVQQRIEANSQALRDIADPSQINSTGDVSKVLEDASSKLARNTNPRILESLSVPLRQQLARELGMTEEELLNTPIGQAENAETVQAARDLLANSRGSVLDAAKDARSNPDDPSKLDAFLTALARHNEISGVVRGQVAREAGRSLQAFNEGDNGQGRTIDQAVSDLSQMAPDAKREAARRLAMLDPNDPGAIERFAREVKPSSTADKLYEAWMNSILSGGAVVAKTFGDTLQLSSNYVTRPLAGALDFVRALLTGSPRTRYVSDVIPAFQFGLPEAFRAFARTFQNEVGSIDSENEFEPRRIAIKGTKGRIVRIPSRLLAAITDLFHVANYSSELHASAWRMATKEGLRGSDRVERMFELTANPTDDMKEHAWKYARSQTFQDNFQGEGWYNAAMREALKLKSNKIARWAFPFVRTPMNIVREGVRYSPLGLLGTVKGAMFDGLKGGDLTDSLTKNTIGTAAFLYALDKARAGQITGAGPSDPRKRRALENTGWQPYSYLANGKYHSYRRMVPVNVFLGLAGDLADAMRENPKDPAIKQKIVAGIVHTAKNILDVPFLTSTTQLASILESPKQAAHVASYEVIPGFVRNTAHMLDRTIRNPQTPSQEFEANIPGLTGRVPARVDLSGQPVKRPVSQLGGFNPFPTSAKRNDPVLGELARLGVPQTNLPKQVVPSRRGLPRGAGKLSPTTISPSEAVTLQTQESQMFYGDVRRVMASPQWAKLSDTTKLTVLKRIRARIDASRYARLMQLRKPSSAPSASVAPQADPWSVVSRTPHDGWQVVSQSSAQ